MKVPPQFLIASIAILVCGAAASADLAYTTRWEAPGEGGFSTPNVLLDPETGQAVAIVVCESAQGVVCFDLDGQRMWTHAMAPPVTATPAIADLDGDGQEEIVAADSKGNLAALRADGALVWKAQLPGGVIADACPAIADLDGDGHPEILVGDTSGTLSCLAHNGHALWQFTGDGTKMGPVFVADIYDLPGREIILPSHDRHIYALSAQGEWLWDIYRPDDLFPNSTPLLADVDGDDTPELYIGGGLHHFYRIDPASRRIVVEENVFMHVNNAIQAADLDGDGKDEVVFGNKGGGAWCYGDGGFRWSLGMTDRTFYAAPTFVDLDNDAELEVILYDQAGVGLDVLECDGSPTFSAATGTRPTTAPLVGDFDRDGLLDIVSTTPAGLRAPARVVWGNLSVPYKEDPRNRVFFAGNRARSGLPPSTKDYLLVPTPQKAPGEERASLTPASETLLLSGPNTWRYDVSNPDEQRLVFLAEIVAPDGSTRRIARHVLSAKERVTLPFTTGRKGAYRVTQNLVEAEALKVSTHEEEVLKFKGFKSDKAFLNNVAFEQTAMALDSWRAGNPGAVHAMRQQLVALRGTLEAVEDATPEERSETLPPLRRSALRLRDLSAAGASLAPSGSFIAWAFDPWAYFDSRDTLPTPEERTDSLDITLCVDEYESLALNLTNLGGRTLEVRVLPGDIEGETSYPANEHLAFRRAVAVPTNRRELVADALPKLDQAGLIAVAPFETEQLWLTLNAKGMEPGAYTAALRLKSLEPDPTERIVTLKISVLALALPRPRPLRFCLWAHDSGDLGADNPNALEDLIEHGASVFFGRTPKAACDSTGRLEGPIDFSAHDESVARLAQHGILLFTGPQGGLKGQPFRSAAWKKGFVAFLRGWVAHSKALGLDYGDWALYPYDEPSSPFADTTLNLVEVAKLIRRADPNILIYTDPTSGTNRQSLEMLDGLIDIWCPSSELLERFTDEIIPFAKQVGKEVWFYDAAGRAKTLSCLGIYRRRFWFAWDMGFTGAGWWCYASNANADRWEGITSFGDFFATVYDGSEGQVVSSKRWEVAREGIEDYEYLYLLREAIRNAEKRGVSGEVLEEARKILREVPTRIEANLHRLGRRLPLTPDSVPAYRDATRQIQQARREIAEACISVNGL